MPDVHKAIAPIRDLDDVTDTLAAPGAQLDHITLLRTGPSEQRSSSQRQQLKSAACAVVSRVFNLLPRECYTFGGNRDSH